MNLFSENNFDGFDNMLAYLKRENENYIKEKERLESELDRKKASIKNIN